MGGGGGGSGKVNKLFFIGFFSTPRDYGNDDITGLFTAQPITVAALLPLLLLRSM